MHCVAEADIQIREEWNDSVNYKFERELLGMGWWKLQERRGSIEWIGVRARFERMRREGGERREESRLSEFETVFPHVDVLRAGSRPDDDEGGMEVYASLLISWLHPAMWEI